MSQKELKRELGEPIFKGGFVSSQDDSQAYVPQNKRYVTFQVFHDSSVVVLRQDTVVEIKPSFKTYQARLESLMSRRRRLKRQSTPSELN